tara:strand:+ start:695 stop:1156 length:462 start_codon:yes stop_codon:yes gene_type:complete
MSTVVLDTITGKSTATTITIGSTPVVSASANSMTIRGEGSEQTSIQQGLAKAWLSMNGTGTIAVRDSFNMTGITDQGTGLTTVTIANNMSDGNYSLSGASGTFIGNSDNVRFGLSTETEPPTSTLFRTITREANDDTNRDVTYSFAQVFGDLA